MSETEVLRIFEANRPHLMGLAYRMSGTVTDAEDVIQDTWLRWQGTDHVAVACPKAYLLRVTMRLCLDRARSAQARREVYVGPWLPEPIMDLAQIGAAEAGPQSQAERTDELSVALLLVLERLSPLERAAFLLHDVFDFSFDETAPRSVVRLWRVASSPPAQGSGSGKSAPPDRCRPTSPGSSLHAFTTPCSQETSRPSPRCWPRMQS